MSNLPQEIHQKIAEEAYQKGIHLIVDENYKQGYISGKIDGATEWAEKVHELIDLLEESSIQIEYLHEKFGETGSGNNVLARIETTLAKYKEVNNG